MTDRSTDQWDVVVVGFGPVGATLAGLLGRRGVRTLVVDRDHDIYPLPRAAHFDFEIMRILQELGIADELVPRLRINEGMDFVTADHEILLRMASASTVGPSGWHASYFFHQPDLERTLREAVRAIPGVEVRTGLEVTGLAQAGPGDGVVLQVRDVERGTDSELRTSWVIGCDGARSTVRRLSGITMEDLAFDEPWLVVDTVEHADHGLGERALQVCDPRRPTTLVPMPTPRRRFEFMLLPGETADEIERPEKVEELIGAWAPIGGFTIERTAVYTFHGLLARDWRAGRVLLAGDAAHQMPPFLGQGMCSGMRDAANLAWKLALVVHGVVVGVAADALLATYQEERLPHVRAIVEAAIGFGRVICTLDPAVAEQRNRSMLAARAEAADAKPARGAGGQPPLQGGLVDAPAPAGGFAPQGLVAGRRADDVVGTRFAVITQHPQTAGPWDVLGVVWVRPDEEQAAWLAGNDADGVIVRPDRIVHRVTKGEDALLAALAGLARRILGGPDRPDHDPSHVSA